MGHVQGGLHGPRARRGGTWAGWACRRCKQCSMRLVPHLPLVGLRSPRLLLKDRLGLSGPWRSGPVTCRGRDTAALRTDSCLLDGGIHQSCCCLCLN